MKDLDFGKQHYVLLVISVVALFFTRAACAADTAEHSFAGGDNDMDELAVVLTPARLKQAPRQAPASITLITSTMLDELGITSVPEALRLVPGMAVGMSGGNDYRIGYHGGAGQLPRRLQVLVDSVSFYYGGIARINWASFPISMEDIDRIEVTRNPNAASYGANSFQAVINILTKSASKTLGASMSGYVGARGLRHSRVAVGEQFADTHVVVSAWRNEDDGFDENINGEKRIDSQDVRGLRIKTNSSISNTNTLSMSGSAVWSKLSIEFADANQTSFPKGDARDFDVVVDWNVTASEVSDWRMLAGFSRTVLEQRWSTCYPTLLFTQEVRDLYNSNPEYALSLAEGRIPMGGTAEDDALLQRVIGRAASMGETALAPNCGAFNQDFSDTSLKFEIQNTWTAIDRIKVVSGLGAINVNSKSEAFFDGTEQGWTDYAFGSVEYTLAAVVVSVGGMAEYSERLKDTLEFSSRAALNWHIDNNQTVRIAYSAATRTPDFLEDERNWGFVGRELTIPVDGSRTQLILGRSVNEEKYESEQIENVELAYLANYPRLGVQMDTRIFYEELSDLITGRVAVFDPLPRNEGRVKLTGAEIQVRYKPSRKASIGLGYAYLDSNSNTLFEENLYSRHSGHIFGSYRVNDKLQFSVAYYGSEEISGAPYDKTEAVVNYSVTTSVSISAKATKVTKENEFIVNESSRLVRNAYDKSTTLTLGASLTF